MPFRIGNDYDKLMVLAHILFVLSFKFNQHNPMCLNYDGLNRDKDTPILLLKVLNQEKTIKVRCFNLLQITKKPTCLEE